MTTTFYTVWLGQLVSVVGSGLTSFALGVWIALADRWDRRRAMVLGDAGAALSTLALVLLLWADRLAIWHIYLVSAASAAFSTIQWPAYAAATSLLVPSKDLGRANGMVQFGQAAAEILAPTLAGALLKTIQLQGVILIDLATFAFAVGALLLVRFPRPAPVATKGIERASLWSEVAFGWRYIATRQGLVGLLALAATTNLLWGMVGALITPMILGFASSETLGFTISIAGLGMLAGGLVMSIWGGPRRRITGMLAFEFLSGVCFLLIGLRPSFWLTALGAFGAHVTIAIVTGSSQAVWQSKVAPDVQGRVFATQQMVARATSPLAYLLAGPLADRVFEPLLAHAGPMAESFGQIVGTGPGRGIGLMFLLMGTAKMAVTLVGYAQPRIRLIEDELPDAAVAVPGMQSA
jgi:MFS family permease